MISITVIRSSRIIFISHRVAQSFSVSYESRTLFKSERQIAPRPFLLTIIGNVDIVHYSLKLNGSFEAEKYEYELNTNVHWETKCDFYNNEKEYEKLA